MSTQDRYQRPPLRYRRLGGGYRREDVEFALAELRLTLGQLDSDLETLRERNRELEGELSSARTDIEAFRAKEQELAETMASVLRHASDIEEGANTRGREILSQAEEAATHIRSEATRRLEETSAQVDELVRMRDSLLIAMRSAVGDFDHAITRVEHSDQLFPGAHADPVPEVPALDAPALGAPAPDSVVPFAPPADVSPPAEIPPPAEAPVDRAEPIVQEALQPIRDTVSIPAAPPPEPVFEAPPPPPSPLRAPDPAPRHEPEPELEPEPVPEPPAAEAPADDDPLFDTRVELDAGPFSDFAALSAFERSLAHLPKVEDVYVRRLADDRALIELTLSEAAPLLRTMHEVLPYALDVRSVSPSAIVVNVTVQTPAGAR